MSKKLIFLPYACDPRKNTGVNLDRREGAMDTYCQNFCVALVTLKQENPDCDVALVTNGELPGVYTELLKRKGILVLRQPYDTFVFPADYRWSLAFYKLCALDAMVKRGGYDFYCYLDTDVVANASMDPVWEECGNHILLYDVNHGLYDADYRGFLQEVADFTGEPSYITHYGGEFFAANAKNSALFIDNCRTVYERMRDCAFVTTKGDEFITSIAASRMGPGIKNAGAYIFRFWTGSYRLISTVYRLEPIPILHLPVEKERGMLTLYRRYISRDRYPTRKQIYRCCHLSRPRLKNVVKQLLKPLRGR